MELAHSQLSRFRSAAPASHTNAQADVGAVGTVMASRTGGQVTSCWHRNSIAGNVLMLCFLGVFSMLSKWTWAERLLQRLPSFGAQGTTLWEVSHVDEENLCPEIVTSINQAVEPLGLRVLSTSKMPRVSHVASALNGQRLGIAAQDGFVRLQDIPGRREFEIGKARAASVRWSIDGRYLMVRAWSFSPPSPRETWREPLHWPFFVCDTRGRKPRLLSLKVKEGGLVAIDPACQRGLVFENPEMYLGRVKMSLDKSSFCVKREKVLPFTGLWGAVWKPDGEGVVAEVLHDERCSYVLIPWSDPSKWKSLYPGQDLKVDHYPQVVYDFLAWRHGISFSPNGKWAALQTKRQSNGIPGVVIDNLITEEQVELGEKDYELVLPSGGPTAGWSHLSDRLALLRRIPSRDMKTFAITLFDTSGKMVADIKPPSWPPPDITDGPTSFTHVISWSPDDDFIATGCWVWGWDRPLPDPKIQGPPPPQQFPPRLAIIDVKGRAALVHNDLMRSGTVQSSDDWGNSGLAVRVSWHDHNSSESFRGSVLLRFEKTRRP